jgi:hypothetical protein
MRAARPVEAIPSSPLGGPGGQIAVGAQAKRRALHERVNDTGSDPTDLIPTKKKVRTPRGQTGGDRGSGPPPG